MNLLSIILRKCVRITHAALVIFVATGACDELQTPGGPHVITIGDIHDITLYANSEAFIPIYASINSPITLKIECSPKPKLGYVEAMPNGDFKYTPYINVVGTDDLTFTFRSNTTNEEVLPSRTLKVTINEHTNSSRCQPVTVSDLVADDRLHQNPFSIEPVANDTICFDEYSLSIYQPSASFMPHRGQATVVAGFNDANHRPYINYQWEGATTLEDTIMYKIIDKKDPGNVAYGLILIASGECKSTLRDDSDTLLEGGSVTVDVLANDHLCSPVTSTTVISLVQMPKHGTIEQYFAGVEWGGVLLPGVFVYQDFGSGTWSSDTIIYRYCDRICSTAKLVIRASP